MNGSQLLIQAGQFLDRLISYTGCALAPDTMDSLYREGVETAKLKLGSAQVDGHLGMMSLLKWIRVGAGYFALDIPDLLAGEKDFRRFRCEPTETDIALDMAALTILSVVIYAVYLLPQKKNLIIFSGGLVASSILLKREDIAPFVPEILQDDVVLAILGGLLMNPKLTLSLFTSIASGFVLAYHLFGRTLSKEYPLIGFSLGVLAFYTGIGNSILEFWTSVFASLFQTVRLATGQVLAALTPIHAVEAPPPYPGLAPAPVPTPA